LVSSTHGSLYKAISATATNHPNHSVPNHHKQNHFFSLHSVTIKAQKFQEHKEKISNPRIPENQIHHRFDEFIAILRDSSLNHHHRITLSAIQVQIHHKRNKLDDHREVLR
jgi:hypothetical protein